MEENTAVPVVVEECGNLVAVCKVVVVKHYDRKLLFLQCTVQ